MNPVIIFKNLTKINYGIKTEIITHIYDGGSRTIIYTDVQLREKTGPLHTRVNIDGQQPP
jgi:hypothetical protein